MNSREYTIRSLERRVFEATQANEKAAQDIVKFGANDRFAWLHSSMKQDAQGILAAKILTRLKNEEITIQSIVDDLTDKMLREVTYLIPTNSDHCARVYDLQAISEMIATLDFARREESGVK